MCGPKEAAGYLRFVDFARELWQLERDAFIARNLDTPVDLLRPALLQLLMRGGFRRLDKQDRNRSSAIPVPSGSSPSRPCTPGLAPHDRRWPCTR